MGHVTSGLLPPNFVILSMTSKENGSLSQPGDLVDEIIATMVVPTTVIIIFV